MSCNTDEWTLFSMIYDLWFHESVMLKPTLNNLTILDSFDFRVYCYQLLHSLDYCSVMGNFFDLTNAKKHGKNNSWSSKIFPTVVGLGVFDTLFFHEYHHLFDHIKYIWVCWLIPSNILSNCVCTVVLIVPKVFKYREILSNITNCN